MKCRSQISASLVFLARILSISGSVNANLMSNLTIEIAGLEERRGQFCFSLFSSSRGFPDSKKDAIESECIKITDNPMLWQFF